MVAVRRRNHGYFRKLVSHLDASARVDAYFYGHEGGVGRLGGGVDGQKWRASL